MRKCGSAALVRAVGTFWLGLMALLPAQDEPIRILLACGGSTHDFENQKVILSSGISERVGTPIEWTIKDPTASFYNNPDWAEGFDLVIHNETYPQRISTEALDRILAPHRAGIPSVLIHGTMLSYPTADNRWFEFCGIVARGQGPPDPYNVKNLAPDHPVMASFGPIWMTPQGEMIFSDEVMPSVTRLAEAFSPKRDAMQTVAWTHLYGENETRVFGTTIGHDNETMLDPTYLDMVTRGTLWALDRSEDFVVVEDEDPLEGDPHEMRPNAFPPSLLTGKPASASSEGTVPLHSASRANDGLHVSRWSAHGDGRGEWWAVDLVESADVKSIALHWEKNAPYQYRIDVSRDGVSYKTVVDETYNTAPNQVATHLVDAPDTRHLRVTFISGCGEMGSLREVAAYGDAKSVLGLENLSNTNELEFSPTIEVALNRPESRDPRIESLKVGPEKSASFFADATRVRSLKATLEGPVFAAIDLEAGTSQILSFSAEGTPSTFVEAIDSPRGMEWDGESLYVFHARGLSAFQDEDGDGVAETERAVIKDLPGIGVTLGIDGWLYCTVASPGAARAMAADGSAIQLHSAGVVRVRTTGRNLHIFAEGTSEIASLAVSPLLEVIGRGTADAASGWSSRVMGFHGLGHFGYPNRFRYFSGETVVPLAEFESGTTHDSIWTEDGVLIASPAEGSVHRFSEGRLTTALKMTGLNAITSDGRGSLYVASDDGIFKISDQDATPAPALDAPVADLLLSPSAAVRLQASRSWLRKEDASMADLTSIAESAETATESRAAAIFTLAQSRDADSLPKLVQFAESTDSKIRRIAIRAIGDFPEAENHPIFETVSTEEDPRVLEELLLAIVQTNSRDSGIANAVLRLAAETDQKQVKRRAIDALVKLKASRTCLEMMENPDGYKIWPTAATVLGQIHEMTVVYGLIDRVNTTGSSIIRAAALEALARLYLREGGWEATKEYSLSMIQGPYLRGETWEGSQHIRWQLEKGLKDRRVSDSFLLGEMAKNGVPVPDFAKLLDATAIDPELEKPTIELLLNHNVSIDDARPFLTFIATNENRPGELRYRAATALAKSDDDQAIREALSVVCDTKKIEAIPLFHEELRNAFIENNTHAERYEWFLETAHSDEFGCGELGWAVLLRLLEGTELTTSARGEIEQTLSVCSKSPNALLRVLAAIEEVRYLPGKDLVMASLQHADENIRHQAALTAAALDSET